MNKITRFALLLVTLVALPACNLSRSSDPQILATPSLPSVGLTVHGSGPALPFAVGQTINFQYLVTNAGSSALAGPVTITSDKGPASCPDLRTVGNQNTSLDPLESLTCTGSYLLVQADVTAGSVTNNATAAVAGVSSSLASVTIRTPENKVLTLTKTASPTTYSQAGQTITFTYAINNSGTASLGPAQFIVNDDRILGPVNCGPPATVLAATQSVTCTALYTTSQADVTAGSMTSTATASGAGATSIQAVSTTLNLAGNTVPQSPSGSYTRGSTVQYRIVEGEWLIQIARCFGADPKAVISANPQLAEPDEISPDDILTIPNLGSNGTIYGPPCIAFHNVQSGDTWNSIAQRYNADIAVLQAANSGVSLSSGTRIRVPLNSAGGPASTGGTSTSPTQSPTVCNQAQMVSDVTVPDGTSMAAGSTFTKTWRLKNTGTCTWTPAYLLVFDHGEPMGAPTTTPLTTVNVAPGSTVDVSVNLKAPVTPGTYQADFRLRAADGVIFGIGSSAQASFWVKIIVPQPAAGATATVPATGSSDVVALLGKKATGSVEVATFVATYTDGPCLETEAGSGILECKSKAHETPFIRLVLSTPADLANSTITGVRIFPKYPGNLPEGLAWTMTRQAIELKLGVPVSPPVDNGNGTLDVEYRTTNPAYRLWATFDSSQAANIATMIRMRIAVP